MWNPSELVIMDGSGSRLGSTKKMALKEHWKKEKQLYVNHHAYQICRIRANTADLKKNRKYIKVLRKEMMRLIRQNPEKYGYRKMPHCYDAAYPRLMKIYHGVGRLVRRIPK